MDGDVAGVRITPPVVEFVDASANKSYSINLSVQNVSRFSHKIRFVPPVTNKFKLSVKHVEQPIAPGLEITAIVYYESSIAEDARDRVILSVDDDVVEIPLYAYTPTPLLDLEGPVDFGMVVAYSQVVNQEVALINHGSISGSFNITYNGSLPIVVSPTSGKVEPKTIQLIKVELVTETPGAINETADVKLEGMKNTKLEIKGCVVEQSLQLLSCDSDSKLSCVSFGPAFYGTDKIEKAFLFNNGPEPIKWVSVLEEGADGEEVGVDLTKSTAAMLATSPMDKIRGKAFDVLTSLITTFPNQGSIPPYQKVPVYFRFSPRFNSSNVGWEASEKPPPRQDFALFMSFEMVGSNDSFSSDNIKPNKKIEIAVTATAVPVLLNIQPSSTFDFGDVSSGEHSSTLCTLSNESGLLPVYVRCRKVAHFNVTPIQSKIGPGKSQDILISFQPNQAGKFQPLQVIDVLGKVCESTDEDATRLISKPFQSIPIQLIGTSIAPFKVRNPKLNPGITPRFLKETGEATEVTFKEIDKIKDQVRPTVINSAQTSLHQQQESQTSETASALIAFPNDRSHSIRPSERGEEYRTPFTKSARHTYVDPDYTYTDEEKIAHQEHKDKYKEYLRNLSQKRKQTENAKEFSFINNNTDLGIKPAFGLRPPKLTVNEIKSPGPYQVSPMKDKDRLLTTRQLVDQERQATTRPVSEGLNAVPTTSVEKRDCKRKLSPQDLHKVIIGPPTIDFGEVCLRSTNMKQLHIVNNLEHHIHVQVTINCKELRQTSPLSQVIPGQTKAQFTLVFESHSEGRFQRSISYSVNGQHESHVLVLAQIVPVHLELSDETLQVVPEPGLPAEAGYRSTVTLYNSRNHPADFTWSPILTDRGTAFSIRPATGTVDAYKDLKCEVVFHPSYFAPLDGEFHLQVHHGNTLKLKCHATLGNTNVQFVERRILFGNVPLNMQTVRTAFLHNSGHNHAMFYVINSTPFPGMSVSPTHGIIPVGGNAEFKIVLSPNAVVKFDTWIQVNIRGWKTIDLRMGGTVEPPEVDIDVKAFKFNGVYCDSSVSIPFNLVNNTSTRVCAEFDLTKHSDFSIDFPKGNANLTSSTESFPNTYNVELQGMQKLACILTFRPTSVASYDFTLPVVINKTGAPSPTPSTFPPTPAPSEHHIITPRPIIVNIPTPRKRVVATGLRPTLVLSASRLDFSLPVSFMELGMPDNSGGVKKQLVLSNESDEKLTWEFDLTSVKSLVDDCAISFMKPGGAFFTLDDISGTLERDESYKMTILFYPKSVGHYSYEIPVLLNNNRTKPYRFITLDALLQAPSITFDPLALVLTPVPLSTAVYADFNLIAGGYIKESHLTVEIPEVEADDGTKISCFDVEFPDGAVIPVKKGASNSSMVSVNIPCVLTFNSSKPLSATVDISIIDEAGRKFNIAVTATADNCLLTVYPFLAAHRNDHQIVCEQDKTLRGPAHDSNSASLGEAVLLPCASSSRPSTRGSTSVTSSQFGATSSSFEDSSDSPSESEYVPSTRDGANVGVPDNSDTTGTSKRLYQDRQNRPKSITNDVAPIQKIVRLNRKSVGEGMNNRELLSRSLGSAVFPFESSSEAHFHEEVLTAAQRWFSCHGWPGGPFPVRVPQSIRRLITRNPVNDDGDSRSPKSKQTAQVAKGNSRPVYAGSDANLNKDVKTIYDMLYHLSGRVVPGISTNQPLPSDTTERVMQMHWQHATLLTFLRGQGASVSAIRPEFLLTPQDYRRWVRIRERDSKRASGRANLDANDSKTSNEKISGVSSIHIEEELFESVSKRAWTDLLLQLYKVLVLSRITSSNYLSTKSLYKGVGLPKVNPDPLVSNVYSTGERIVLAWLNHHYEQQRHILWGGRISESPEKAKGALPPSRWVVNFDYDLLDGLVLASVVAAYCPWLAQNYFSEMYTSPASPEQCLHNTLIFVKAMRSTGIDYDVQATDITDPNPIALLLLCVYLYQYLPQYLPKSKVQFAGSLHSTVRRQVRLSNPSTKSVNYTAFISGRDARDFSLPNGHDLSIPSRGHCNLEVHFKSRLIRPAEAVLVLVSRRAMGNNAGVGSVLVFNMRTVVDDIPAIDVIRGEAPCYELKKIDVPISNPFSEPGNFRIVLVESGDGLPSPLDIGKTNGFGKNTTKTLSSRIKSVKSRTDHGQIKEPSPPPTPPPEERYVSKKGKSLSPKDSTMTSQLTAFFCRRSEISLTAGESGTIQLEFLPFTMGKKFCSMLFVDERVGEFVYAVEAVSVLPLPCPVPFNPNSENSVRVSSAAALTSGKQRNFDENTVYWKCENNRPLEERLLIPVTNHAMERALRIAAKQRMTAKERERRILTGTLDSGSVTAAIASMGMLDMTDVLDDNEYSYRPPTSALPRPRGIRYAVEASSQWFEVPENVLINFPVNFGPKLASELKAENVGPNEILDDGTVPLHVKFLPRGPGHYPCDLILKSSGDIRRYRIDCTVNPAGTTAKLDFRTPAHQSITQNIPIQNASNHDWDLDCTIDADGFYGPSHMIARAGQTTFYPLMFNPHHECTVNGTLTIRNKSGTEHLFTLCGVGESPLALDHLEIGCKCREVTSQTVNVPNYAPHQLTYKVFTDIACLEGDDMVTVLKGHTTEYNFTVSPWRRGLESGILAFIVSDVEGAKHSYRVDSDSDNEDDSQAESASEDLQTPSYLKPSKSSEPGLNGYRVWFSVDINATPANPIGEIKVECPVLSAKDIAIPVKNPCGESVEFDVTTSSDLLQGDPKIVLAPRVPAVYTVMYRPCIVGEDEGEIVFYSSRTGEFSYKLKLICVSPPPIYLPNMQCQLGGWSRQYINLPNPSDEIMEVEMKVDNESNFTVDTPTNSSSHVDPEAGLTFCVHPKSTVDIPIQFMPTSLGAAAHQAKITLKSKQLGEIFYFVAGLGLAPSPMEPVSVSAAVGSSTSLILPFRNPTDVPVLIDVAISDNEHTLNNISNSIIRNNITNDSAFCLLLKHTNSIRVDGRQVLDIPFTFSPDKMKRHEGTLAISVKREDGECWPNETDGVEDLSGLKHWVRSYESSMRSLSRDEDGSVRSIRWIFPVHGIPEVRSNESKEAVLHCQARSRIEERLEVTLTGAMPSVASGYDVAKVRAVTPIERQSLVRDCDGVVVEGHSLAEEFSYRIDYPEDIDAKQHLEQALAISLVRKQRDPHTGLVVLVFNLVFSPFRQLDHTITLTVSSATGGVWSFPLIVRASEPPPDDVIYVEAAGLGKESTVSFKLFSHSKHPTPFHAFFINGSDAHFSVQPEHGNLQPQGTHGTRLAVSFTPTMYGRSYKARLVVQTMDMQWTYDIKGITPEYIVPAVASTLFSTSIARPRAVAQRPKVNFVQKNMKLTATAVSSPIKGMRLLKHIKSQ